MNDEAPRPPSDDDPPTQPTSASSSDSASATPSAGPATEEIPPSGPYFSREQLVRPRQGRYVAGVCVALARATNTDPVLWRVLVAVLGILSGVGVLLYLIGWLIIPAEGDTASPIESLLGKGRSGMAPLSVVLLGAAAVISFGFIVHDGMRASLLAAAVILGAVLLIKRSNGTGSPATFPAQPPPPADPPAGEPVSAYAPAGFASPAATAAPATEPVTEPPLPPRPPFSPPPSGYRPPFAPHGPWAGPATQQAFPPQPPRPPKPPKPPRERSKLGRLTFFAVLMVIGAMAAIDTAGAGIAVSAYFAAALITIALGLIVGAWFGRARGLIALAILTSIGLLVSNGVERWGGEVGNSVYRPQTFAAVADRYDFTAGNATLDLRDIDFTGKSQTITMSMKVGQMRVLLPPTVDTVADVRIDGGRAMLFGQEFTGDRNDTTKSVTDLGSDGTGGGTLKLDMQMDTGNVEVLR
jgi:phage shock protein PspC (stress-responsive transcriptional regulator)